MSRLPRHSINCSRGAKSDRHGACNGELIWRKRDQDVSERLCVPHGLRMNSHATGFTGGTGGWSSRAVLRLHDREPEVPKVVTSVMRVNTAAVFWVRTGRPPGARGVREG